MSAPRKFALEITAEDVTKIEEWISKRGGVALWRSLDLGDPGASWMTPVLRDDGAPTEKPSWKAGSAPVAVITDAADVGVYRERHCRDVTVALVKRGLAMVVSDGGMRRVNRAMDKCRELHGNAHFKRGHHLGLPSINIHYTDGEPVSLVEYLSTEVKRDPL